MAAQAGQTELIVAFVLAGVTIAVCCPVLPAIGLYMANVAFAARHPSAQAARIFNIVMLCLSCLVVLGYAAMLSLPFFVGMYHRTR